MDNLLIQQGVGKDQLLQKLSEIDSITTIDNFILNNQTGNIDLLRKNGRLYWKLSVDNAPLQKIRQRGKTMKSFLTALNDAEEKSFSSNFSVICYQGTLPKRSAEGYIKTRWFLIDPLEPYVMENGRCTLQTILFSFSEGEYAAMLETKLAFYDTVSGICYPMKYEALPTIARFIDCSTAFKNMDDCLLGPAFLIASRIVNKKEVNFLVQELPGGKSKKVRPVLSIVGRNYQYFSHEKVMEKLLDILSEHYIYAIEKWEISNTASTAYVKLYVPGFDHIVKISIGRAAGYSISVVALSRTEDGVEIYIKKNTAVHSKDSNWINLMNGIPTAFQEFELLWILLKDVTVDKGHIKEIFLPLKKPLGKIRFLELIKEAETWSGQSGQSCICAACRSTAGIHLHQKETNLVKAAYFSCMKNMVS